MSADPQKDALYEWEDSFWGWNRNLVSLAECRRYVETACAYYRVRPPKVTQHHVCSISWSIPSESVISLQAKGSKPGKGGRNIPTALHEAAHHIVYWTFGERVQDHGPTFLGVYLWLLEKADVAPAAALWGSAKGKGLRWRLMPPTRPEISKTEIGLDRLRSRPIGTDRAQPDGGATARRLQRR